MDVVDITLMDSWAEEEFAAADLGDARRTKRLIALADTFARRPSASLPQAAQDPAMLKAAYRFFDTEAIEPDAILASHCTATHDRCSSVPLVLAVQDTSELDWSHHPATTDLGPLHTKTHLGLLMHTTLAITPEAVPLGILQQYVWARDAATFGALPDQHSRAFEDKESYRWVRGLAAINAARDACPTTQFVLVADAEADIYDLMVAERRAGVDLLLRAGQDRRVAHPEARRLWEALPLGRRAGKRVVHIPARDGKPARTAELTLFFQDITLQPPKHRAKEELAAVTVAAVWAIEEQPPAGSEALEWLLLTSVPVATLKQALTVLEWYCRRWGIEIWHKTLKSGCAIEARQLETADRLRRCLALYSVIAWRVMFSTMLARAVPEVACTAVLDAAEWQALYCHIHRTLTLP
ncbi:MAG TPA: IS4 family transposase, partial [Roseiflexaceae bacterium]|nr:IS4 family transposase [Roseiflexaceae bacterium]